MDPGKMIQDRYELVEPLGKGGMADVWRAQDHRLSRPVAIKFLATRLADDPEFLVRFFSEAQAVARISHPGVVKVLDFGEFEERPYLVMEVVEGGPLTELTGAPMEPDRAFAIVLGAAAAAGAAHQLGIVHRDIKPGNILLDIDGAAKLADFGIASSGRSERLTATGAAIGSPNYISPEQASGGDATPASDVYSLGIVLYELLCGHRPFEGDNVTAIAIAQIEEQPAPPTTHVPELGAAIDHLVLRCLAKVPAERFADGTELATALERFDTTVPEPEDDVVVAPPLWWRNRKVLVGAAVVALLIAIPLVGGFASSDDSTATAEDAEDSLPNVGGLKMKKSPSPTPETDGSGAATTSPSPTADEKDKDRTESGDSGDEPEPDRAGVDELDPEPTPDPEETATEPTPEPTHDGASPAPEP